MAYPRSRSCNVSLHEGMTDGAHKKAIMNRGGFPEMITPMIRSHMAGVWHGFNEVVPKYMPDGRVMPRDSDDYAIAPQDRENV